MSCFLLSALFNIVVPLVLFLSLCFYFLLYFYSVFLEETNQSTKTSKKSKPSKDEIFTQIEKFWQYDQPLDSSLVIITPPTNQKDILELLGNLPLPYEEAQEVKQSLQQIYQTVSQKALMMALGQED